MIRLVLCALFLSLALPFAARADVITIRADEWCPYNCAPSAKKIGFGIEIAKEIFEKAGHSIDYRILTWTRAIEETRANNYTAILGANQTEVPDFLYPKEAIGLYQTAFASLKEKPFDYGGPNSLQGKIIGVIQSYSYDDDIDEYIKESKNDPTRVDMTAGDEALVKNLNKLMAGRIDVVVDGAYVLLYKADEMQISDKVHFSSSDKYDQIYIAFSPKNPKSQEYADILDKGIAEMRASGRLKEILARYGLKDWKR
jgi:polar amino acid transport system substrate-binding protein